MVKVSLLRKLGIGLYFTVASGIAAVSLGKIMATKPNTWQEGTKACMMENIRPKSKKEIRQLVSSVDNPKQAFDAVVDNMRFPMDDSEKAREIRKKYKPCDRGFYSLSESFAIGGGVCRDGAIAHCALLSDDLDYDCKVTSLYAPKDSERNHHSISIFTDEKGKLGYASFNDSSEGKGSIYKSPRYDTLDELLDDYFSSFEAYSFYKMTPEQMKFGRGMARVDIGAGAKKKIKSHNIPKGYVRIRFEPMGGKDEQD